MTIVIAPDKFKGSLTAQEVCEAVMEGLLSVDPQIKIISIPLADGGEGTGDLLTRIHGGSDIPIKVLDPLFSEIDSHYGISVDGSMAFIEMAHASGLQLLKKEDRNPLKTTTLGTGQLILDALNQGVKKIVLGIGGSATNDAGIGMAEALGFRFYNIQGEKLKPVGENLVHIHAVSQDHIHPRVANTEFIVLCDVENVLNGKNGAAYVFGPQKGADTEAVKRLDLGLVHFKKIIEAHFQLSLDFPGAGAAGGLGAGAKVFLKATLTKGFDYISKITRLEEAIAKADYVVTGEGKIDEQTLSGKVVKGVAEIAAHHQKPCIAVTGSGNLSPAIQKALHLSKVLVLSDENTSEKEAIIHAYSLLKERTAIYFRQILRS